LVLRMGSANGTGDDGDGQDTGTPRDISDDYFQHGMIYNGTRSEARQELAHINRNPIYETMRRVAHDRTRLIGRMELKGYEVSGGKSILYFDRLSRGVSDADMWEGIAPSEDAVDSGEIKHNVKYIVTSGTTGITYNDERVTVGSTFTGVKGVSTFTKDGGDEVVKQYDGIIATAGEQSTDNNWSMFLTSIGYQPADGSDYKPDLYSDIMGWGHDRCATFSHDWTTNPNFAYSGEILRHVTPGPTQILQRSENPSGYRYVLGSHTPPNGSANTNLVTQQNDANCSTTGDEADCQGIVDHYTSCQVYVPDYKIESVVMSGSDVKVTLEGRLRRNSTAPSNVTNTSAGWDTYLSTETGPRSDENAVVEYLRYSLGSGTDCLIRIGDQAPDAFSGSGWIPTWIKGACMPRFYFTRQIPKVYEDNNDLLDTHDTRMVTDEMLWLDLMLRAICEGFIDEKSTNGLREFLNPISLKNECHNKRLFDYTYENLLSQANFNRWQTVVPLSKRSDNPKMYGPFPDVTTYAAHFNQIANAINKLYRARLYVPLQVKFRNIRYEGTGYIGVNGDGNCYNGAVWGEDLAAPEAGQHVSTGPWIIASEGGDTIIAFQKCDIRQDADGNCILYNDRQDVEYFLELDDLVQYSLPPELRALVVDDQGTGFLGTVDLITEKKERIVVANEEDSWGYNGAANGLPDDYKNESGEFQDWVDDFTSPTTCEVVTSGTLKAPLPDVSDYIDTHGGNYGEGSEKTKNLTWFEVQAFVQVPLV